MVGWADVSVHHNRWTVENECVMHVDGVPYVKLRRKTRGFASVVFNGCSDLPSPLPPCYSLTASVGYQDLVRRRQAQQNQEYVDKELETVPALFKNRGQQARAPNKRARQTRDSLKKAREHPATMTLDLGNQTVDVLRAVHPRDDLCVRFDEQTLETVITFLQQSAWSTDAMKKKRQDVPTDAPGSNNFLSLHLHEL